MARHPLPSFVGDSIHGQTQAALMKLHQQSLERTINSTLTFVDNSDSAAAKQLEQQQQRALNSKKKKYYPWVQRDSQNQRNKIGQEGSRRRQRHDNDKFIHHPFAVLYQVDLPFPGYDRDAPTFHWKYDAMIESLISNNPPSSRRSKFRSATATSTDDRPSATAVPVTGHRLLTRAQRKDIKKVHVPQGIVMQYEGELVSFLDRLTLSSDDNDEGSDASLDDCDVQSESSGWVFVQQAEALAEETSSPAGKAVVEKLVPQPPTLVEAKESAELNQQQDEEERLQIYLRWDIQDQFLRFVAHALCTFYGLVSFSKTATDGKRLVYICHPTHLNSISQLATATPSLAPVEPAKEAPTRPKLQKRQSTLEQVQELPLHELEQLWNKVEPVKVMNWQRPDITFFEYLYPSTSVF